MKESKNRPILMEVAMMRPILILCIVIGHSFAIFSGAWPTPFEDIILESSIYSSANPLFISFQLAGFVFISGYVNSYINCTKSVKPNIIEMLLKKTKRLLVPAWFFGAIYYMLFLYESNTFTIKSCLLEIFFGAGHLWFLPMLFGCILLAQICEYFRIRPRCIFITLLLIGLLPFQFIAYTQFLHYAFYFFFGQIVWQKHFDINLKNKAFLCMNLAVYVLTFILYDSQKADMLHCWNSFISYMDWRAFMYIVFVDFIKMLMCISGILFLFGAILWILSKFNIQKNRIVEFSNKVCYGVYIYHQFVLWYLVYHTGLVDNIGITELPFYLLLVALAVSIVLVQISLKTKVGRFLIG